MESAANLNRLFLKLVLLFQVDIQESPREDNAKINFLGITLGDQKVMERSFFRLSKSLKFKILTTVVGMLQHMLGLLQSSRFEVPGGWNYYSICYLGFFLNKNLRKM